MHLVKDISNPEGPKVAASYDVLMLKGQAKIYDHASKFLSSKAPTTPAEKREINFAKNTKITLSDEILDGAAKPAEVSTGPS